MGIASDDNEVRRLRRAFRGQGLGLRVQRAKTYSEHLQDDPLWTIVQGDQVVEQDVTLDSLFFMAEQFGR